MAEKDTSNRGFGSMDHDKQREIAREGGRASHGKGSPQGGSHAQGTRGGSSEQHAEAGRQSHKNAGNSDDRERDTDRDSEHGGSRTRGGSPEQHAEAGRQSHKNR